MPKCNHVLKRKKYIYIHPEPLIHFLHFCHSEPIFVDAHLIPDGSDPNDAKLYFFFRERLMDNSGNTKNIHTMVARVCPVSEQAKLIFFFTVVAIVLIFIYFFPLLAAE